MVMYWITPRRKTPYGYAVINVDAISKLAVSSERHRLAVHLVLRGPGAATVFSPLRRSAGISQSSGAFVSET
jgi:hypothetical protein